MEARGGGVQAMPPHTGPCERAEKGEHPRDTGGDTTSVCGGEWGSGAVEILIGVGPEALV